MTPIVEQFLTPAGAVQVVRDDLFPGGTKARFIPLLFDGVDEVVYASPAEGGAQTALATVAAALGKHATIFVAQRKDPHPRARMAKRLGAKVMQVSPGYLSVVQSRAAGYATYRGAKLLPFGLHVPEAAEVISAAARSTGLDPAEVWCASGSGVLARALGAAWPKAAVHVVQVGRLLKPEDVPPNAVVHVTHIPFEKRHPRSPPFPSDGHYDAKAWWEMQDHIAHRPVPEGTRLFWNVTGPAQP
jgi:hypothetical protein